MATPIWALAACRLASAARTSGRCSHQLRRQADRQVARQPQRRELELLDRLVARKTAAQRRQQVALLRQLLLQRRQGLLDLGQRRLLRHHVGLGDLAELALAPQQPEHVGLDLDDASRRRDLAAQRGLLHGRAGQVGRQGQIGRLELEALGIRLRRQRLDRAPGAAEHVGRIGHVQLPGEEIERRRVRGTASDGVADRQAAAGSPRNSHRRRETTRPVGRRRSRLATRSAACAACRSGLAASALLDQAVERLGMEQRPPLPRQIEIAHEALGLRRPACRPTRCAARAAPACSRSRRGPAAGRNRGRPRSPPAAARGHRERAQRPARPPLGNAPPGHGSTPYSAAGVGAGSAPRGPALEHEIEASG